MVFMKLTLSNFSLVANVTRINRQTLMYMLDIKANEMLPNHVFSFNYNQKNN